MPKLFIEIPNNRLNFIIICCILLHKKAAFETVDSGVFLGYRGLSGELIHSRLVVSLIITKAIATEGSDGQQSLK